MHGYLCNVQSDLSSLGRNGGGIKAMVFCLAFLLLSGSRVIAAADVNAIYFNIPSQRADTALRLFAEQSDTPLLFSHDEIIGITTNRVVGQYPLSEALEILLNGSGIIGRINDNGVLTITSTESVINNKAGEQEMAKTSSSTIGGVLTAFLAGLLGTQAGPAMAQGAPAAGPIEEIVTIGTRAGRDRSVMDLAVPVDVFNEDDLVNTGHTETARLLQQLAPSFNFGNNTTSDGSDTARPATLRGLGPDQVLVLVNGKRHVGQSWLNVGGSLGRGTTGTDLNTIPVGAIKRIEVLRDGASTSYGSDAIAGVINIVLKDDIDETSFRASAGQTYDGDGFTYLGSITKGLKLGDGGFLSLTAEIQNRDKANRAGPSNRAFTLPISQSTDGVVVNNLNGNGESDNTTFVLNAMLPLAYGTNTELYAFGTYHDRDGESAGVYRFPFQADRSVPQVFPNGFLPWQTTNVEDYSLAGGIRGEFGDGWSFDLSANHGKNRFTFGANNTVNASIAAQYVAQNFTDVNNDKRPSAGDILPTFDDIAANSGPNKVRSGGLSLDQNQVVFDIKGQVDNMPWGAPLFVAAGAEYRDETYEIIAGQLESFSCGLSADPMPFPDVVSPYFPGLVGAGTANCGVQGFPGIPTSAAGKINRDSISLYFDLETNITDKWRWGAGARWEDYEFVPDRLSGKVNSRYDFTDNFAIRASFSTGFRAPSLPQIGFTSQVSQAGSTGVTQTLLANFDDPFTQLIGVEGLGLEKSRNVAAGFVWSPLNDLNITVDFYQIKIKDRIGLSENLDAADLIAAGFPAAAANLTSRTVQQASVRFNALNTRTRGVDVVGTHTMDLFGGDLKSTLSYAFTRTVIEGINTPPGFTDALFVGPETQSITEDFQPNHRVVLDFDYQYERIGTSLRANWFGQTSTKSFTAQSLFSSSTGGPVIPFGLSTADEININGMWTLDMELSYDVTDNIQVAFGGNNILDNQPNKLPNNAVIRFIFDGGGFGGPPNASFGASVFPSSSAVPAGALGGYYYFRTSVRF